MARSVCFASFLSILAVTPMAFAQGEAPAPAPTAPAPAEKPVTAGATVSATTTTTAPATTTTTVAATGTTDDSGTDFSKIVGKIGVGYFGGYDLALGVGGATPGTVTTQIVGVRYFFSEKLGIDVGVGLGMTSGSSKVTAGNTTTTTDAPSTLGFSLKGGVPIIVSTGKHYSFFFEPQAIFGYAGQTVKAPPGTTGPDTKHNGTRFTIGGSAGALVQFGFIGIPQLTMDATMGLGLDLATAKTEGPTGGGGGPVETRSVSRTSFATFSASQPWNIFHSTVEAVYHF